VNPPTILVADKTTAEAAKNYGIVCGIYPPPRRSSPPTAVTPETALVIDISGVWSEG
jgi:hypothetical protein